MRQLDQELILRFKNEFEVMKSVRHPGIAKYFKLFENQQKSELYLILELCKGKPMDNFVLTYGKNIPESLALQIL